MDRSTRIRMVLAAPVLGAVYFYLLIYSIGWTSAQRWPLWWYGVFPSRHSAGVTWLIVLHTAGVLSAAAPVGIATVVLMRREAVLLATIVGVLGSMLGIMPSTNSDIWPLYWNSHPVFVVTDEIKIIGAVPLAAWLIRKVSSNGGIFGADIRQQA